MRAIMLAAIILTAASCAPYRPVVDAASLKDRGKYESDLIECEALARQNTNPEGDALGGAVVGGGIGAGLGALIAAIFDGSVWRGAALGGVFGGAQGAAQGGISANQEYEQIYAGCMRGRGYNILN
ncbi:MAG: hypothetical protein ACT4NX_09920 [Deltaproteobacteria bacterium]